MAERQKSLTGIVVSDKMDKTVVVRVDHTSRHRLYRKIIRHSKRYFAHDDRLEAKPGDMVRIVESRPMSRHKRWRVAEIVERGEVAEIAPREIDTEYITMHREREAPPQAAAAEAPEGEVAGELVAADDGNAAEDATASASEESEGPPEPTREDSGADDER
jgi:small subunit ribosomal protein S17